MLLYILYNTDLLETPDNLQSEDAIGYIDDITLIAIGADLTESTNHLQSIMTKDGGGLE